MKLSFSKKKIALMLILLALMLNTLFAFAANYTLASYRQPFYYGNVVNFRWSGISGAYQNAFQLGLNKWNASQNDFKWGLVSSTPSGCSDNFIITYYSMNLTLYGSTVTKVNTNGKLYSCEIGMNTRSCAGHTAYFFQSVATHELGHAMSLLDYNSGTVIMNQNRNRESIYTPQSDDILGVTTAY